MKTKKGTILNKLRKSIIEQENGNRSDLKCVKCGLNKFLTVDHIIPVFLLEQFCLKDEKYNMEDNFQYLCKFCNQQKGSGIDVRNPKTFELLEEIIKRTKNDIKL